MDLHWTFNPDEGEARLVAGDRAVGRVYHDPDDSLFYHGVVGDGEVYYDNQPFVAMDAVESRARELVGQDSPPAQPTAEPESPRPFVYKPRTNPVAIDTPFPVRPDLVVSIRNLPRDLTPREAERLGAFIRALALPDPPEPPAPPPRGA